MVMAPKIGIIPARAGFTALRKRPVRSRRDHPRSRGVYPGLSSAASAAGGSSPLARGLPGRPCGWAWRRGDHPRSRGVYEYTGGHSSSITGSSPLARGLLREQPVRGVRLRIIPARAGFTGTTRSEKFPAWDHPRSRGVYSLPEIVTVPVVGSSPLARGLPDGSNAAAYPTGIIPARAGFTSRFIPSMALRRDHPRSRGVYREERHGRPGHPRIIPARAGFTSLRPH